MGANALASTCANSMDSSHVPGSFRGAPASEANLSSPVEAIQAYVYQPIRQRTEMRLFLLGPGDMEDPIRGNLVTINVDDHNQYDAISYTWADENGDATKCFNALIGTACIPITRNCQAALKRVRSPYCVKSIWVDAICINQEKDEERGHQVNLMPHIYTRAKTTFVYVGESTDGCQDFLATLKLGRERYESLIWNPNDQAAHFLNRPYFSRIWVIQEIALSGTKVVVCGGTKIPWSAFEAEINSLWKGMGKPPPLFLLGQRRLRDATELFGLLKLGRQCKATDPKD